MSRIAYVNGRYVPHSEAAVHVEDRGYQFADGVYEVIHVYGGRFVDDDPHLNRLERSLRELRIDAPMSRQALKTVLAEVVRRNRVREGIVYMQITRGVAPRTHYFPPEGTVPTVYAFANAFVRPDPERWEQGYSAITVPDRRWARADLKTIGLLPNVLSQQAAVDAGAADALQVKDGVAIEGSHNNVFGVFDGAVTTHPATHEILHGVGRGFVMELARGLGMPVVERAIPLEEMRGADEIFFTGTTTEVRPTVELDGQPVGDGNVGPVAKALYEAFKDGALEEVAGG